MPAVTQAGITALPSESAAAPDALPRHSRTRGLGLRRQANRHAAFWAPLHPRSAEYVRARKKQILISLRQPEFLLVLLAGDQNRAVGQLGLEESLLVGSGGKR